MINRLSLILALVLCHQALSQQTQSPAKPKKALVELVQAHQMGKHERGMDYVNRCEKEKSQLDVWLPQHENLVNEFDRVCHNTSKVAGCVDLGQQIKKSIWKIATICDESNCWECEALRPLPGHNYVIQ